MYKNLEHLLKQVSTHSVVWCMNITTYTIILYQYITMWLLSWVSSIS